MVQFVFTPWCNRAELLKVRAQLYPHASFTTTATVPSKARTKAAPPLPPSSSWWASENELRAVERAVARVFMWVHRGGCPHVVESTALLMAAIVFDARGGHDAVAAAGVTAGYLVGFTRFVTGLLDSHQDKARKLSMYGIAKTLGLPASFVELRHQGTHEPMPSLGQLRPAARRALVWIWEYYWKNLPEVEQPVEESEGQSVTRDGNSNGAGKSTATLMIATSASSSMTTLLSGSVGKMDVRQSQVTTRSKTTTTAAATTSRNAIQERMCRAALLGFLQRQEGDVGAEAAREGLIRQLSKWNETLVLRVLADVGVSSRDAGILLRAVKLSRALRDLPTEGLVEAEYLSQDELMVELTQAQDELQQQESQDTQSSEGAQARRVTGKRKYSGCDNDEAAARGGWRRWHGSWTPKPIGVL